MLRVSIPNDREKIIRQIEALEYLIDNVDKTDKEISIHQQAINDLKNAL